MVGRESMMAYHFFVLNDIIKIILFYFTLFYVGGNLIPPPRISFLPSSESDIFYIEHVHTI